MNATTTEVPLLRRALETSAAMIGHLLTRETPIDDARLRALYVEASDAFHALGARLDADGNTIIVPDHLGRPPRVLIDVTDGLMRGGSATAPVSVMIVDATEGSAKNSVLPGISDGDPLWSFIVNVDHGRDPSFVNTTFDGRVVLEQEIPARKPGAPRPE